MPRKVIVLISETLYDYAGYHGCASRCRVRVYQQRSGAHVIVFSELCGALATLGENTGTSITNMAEELATAWRQPYRDTPVLFIEHYPARGYYWLHRKTPVWDIAETFDRVRFDWSNRQQRYVRAHWTHLGRAGAEACIGEAWPEPVVATLDDDAH